MDKTVVAAYDYDATDDTQLTFKEGDTIIVLEEDEGGWYLGRLQDGTEGYFPSTYIEQNDSNDNDNDNSSKNNDETTLIVSDANSNNVETEEVEYEKKQKIDTEEVEEVEEVDLNYDQKTESYKTEPNEANDDTIQSGPLVQISHGDSNNIKNLSKSLLKEEKKRMSQSFSQLIDATEENYYSANVLNLKYNPNAKSRFGLASYYMTYIIAFSSFMMGWAAFPTWYIGSKYIYANNITSKTLCLVCGLYCMIVSGITVFIWNLRFGKERHLTKWPTRAICYFILSIIPFLTYVTSIIGVMYLCNFTFSLLAWKRSEEYLFKDGERRTGYMVLCNYLKSIGNNCCSKEFYSNWFKTIKRNSELKKYAFFGVYALFNLIYCMERFFFYVSQVNEFNDCADTTCPEGVNGISGTDLNIIANANGDGSEARVVTMLLPIAKFMGNLLDINCAFIMFPVCRSFITKLYNMSTDQRRSAKCCNWILSFFPLDSAIDLHIFMSGLIVIGAVVHTWGHYLHYAQVPLTYHEVFGNSVWITGALIAVIMVLIYGTSLSAVRHGKYELFWYTHHLFIIFFIATIFHGRGGWGPNFWKWILVPGALYCFERFLREYRARKAVGVISICHMNNEKAKIYCIELEKIHHLKDFREGQYVFLKAPIISRWQWHPFTISSPPEQKTLTIHIRNMGPGSWTDRLQEFYQALSPNKCYTELYHREAHNLVPQAIGPDGNNLMCIDGPISAPTQHLGEYSTSIVIGAGIGVTPMRAALLSIVYYRFKRGIGHSFPDNAYCVWIVNYKQLSAYKWMCRTLKEIEEELYDMRSKSKDIKNKVIEIHIYVTSTPAVISNDDDDDDDDALINNDTYSDLSTWGTHYDDMLHDEDKINTVQRNVKAPFDEIDIWKLLKNPMDEVQQMGDIFIHKGRPKWNELFQPIQEKHIGQQIGVMFCGPHIIAKDLQKNCAQYTDFETKTRFVFHKENY